MSIDIVIGGRYALKNGIAVGNDPIWILTVADLRANSVRLEPNNKVGLPICFESGIEKFNEMFKVYNAELTSPTDGGDKQRGNDE